MQANIQFDMVRDMHASVKRAVYLEAHAAGTDKRRVIKTIAVFDELCNMLDAGKPTFAPKKGKPCMVMFVGLQGSGKTTTCTKYAHYHQKIGFKPALVCADTFRAGAFDQLKQNATKIMVPFYGSYMESDPIKIVVEGVERFRKENCDLIIVDTSGRHKQEAALFEEMRQVSEARKPDLVIFVMDGSIGQAAFAQAQAFRQSVLVGAVIVTKMNGHAKGCGALSLVGGHQDDLEGARVAAAVHVVLVAGNTEHIRLHMRSPLVKSTRPWRQRRKDQMPSPPPPSILSNRTEKRSDGMRSGRSRTDLKERSPRVKRWGFYLWFEIIPLHHASCLRRYYVLMDLIQIDEVFSIALMQCTRYCFFGKCIVCSLPLTWKVALPLLQSITVPAVFKMGLPRMTSMASSSGISRITKSVKIVMLATTTGTSSQMPIGKGVDLSAICREILVGVNLSSSSLR
ncbi:hypothetical protein ZWY2020_042729 [Hordeum vulgare]|nr:hypothetical protein ZWY2020_042729 [Hordeum vulgare]